MSSVAESLALPSSLLTALQERSDAPFGLLFLRISISDHPTFLAKSLTTQTNDETSNDGTSKLDPLYDEDEVDDEEIPEKY